MKKILTILGAVGILINGLVGPVVSVFAENISTDVSADDILDDISTGDENYENDEAAWEAPELYIRAVNPGYKIDGVNNVGEMIEIARGDDSDAPILLAGTVVSYTNSSGASSILFEFPENSWMNGESILLRLASSPGSELANATYKKTLAMKAGLELIIDGEVADEVCFTGKTGCYKAFSSSEPTSLVRDVSSGEFAHVFDYAPEYAVENYTIVMNEEEEGKGEAAAPQCRGVQFSEILSYYETSKAEQFVEFYNSGAGRVVLDGCKLRYKNKNYVLSGAVEPEGYYVYYPEGFSLTKNPTNANKLELVDMDGAIVDALEYPNGQRKGTAWAWIGYDAGGAEVWRTTYAPTPGEANNFQEFKTCEAGKVINKATGNCVKVASVTEKVCKAGYHLNILTGRCNKDATATEKTCKEGYYLNPETNRCRKIVENKGADYSLEPENYEENSAFVAVGAVAGVLAVGGAYLIWEFRREIAKIGRKVWRAVRR